MYPLFSEHYACLEYSLVLPGTSILGLREVELDQPEDANAEPESMPKLNIGEPLRENDAKIPHADIQQLSKKVCLR